MLFTWLFLCVKLLISYDLYTISYNFLEKIEQQIFSFMLINVL